MSGRATDDRVFELSRSHLRARHRNTVLGLIFAVALCWIAWSSRVDSDDTYQATLLMGVIVTIVLFGVFHLVSHVRYTLRSRRHQVVVGGERITFVTGEERSVLALADVLLVEPQKRLGEGPSLMMRLRNGRIVRLEGYERQAELMALVTERFERVSAGARRAET